MLKPNSRRIHGPTSHSYFSQRLRLHYVDWGNVDAPPLLLIHGGRDHCRNWDWVAEELRDDYHIIAPDLRGHGDSQWMMGGSYHISEYVYDIAQLLHQTKLTPIKIIGHSLGGAITLRYAGLYPDLVKKVVAIEGLGPPPHRVEERKDQTTQQRLHRWIEQLRDLSGRTPRRYKSLEEAWSRMHEANPHLSEAQARHLTIHGVNQNEDCTYSWKFDNYIRATPPFTMTAAAAAELWSAIDCPTLLIYGTDSWAKDPRTDGRAEIFKNVQVEEFKDAGHWVHHDQLDGFLKLVKRFLKE
jgi:pimeloyl-ACP methyl ester carboxylesterase